MPDIGYASLLEISQELGVVHMSLGVQVAVANFYRVVKPKGWHEEIIPPGGWSLHGKGVWEVLV
jgi:vacuolar-type H+-ATPase subunit I/STV1